MLCSARELKLSEDHGGLLILPEKPFVTSGVRLGSPAMTTRGFKEAEAVKVAHLIADVLDNPHDEANIAAVRAKVAELTKQFPVYA